MVWLARIPEAAADAKPTCAFLELRGRRDERIHRERGTLLRNTHLVLSAGVEMEV